ncbi:unnamed protein product, partial [Musa textilis]
SRLFLSPWPLSPPGPSSGRRRSGVGRRGSPPKPLRPRACPPLRCLPKPRPAAAARFLSSPVEASFCVESLIPIYGATASALMTSMLNVSLRGYGWLSQGRDETR